MAHTHLLSGTFSTLPGANEARANAATTAISTAFTTDQLPRDFPTALWQAQEDRYLRYWDWFTGEALNSVIAETKRGVAIPKFPLHLNATRNFARKHSALLFGEVPDNDTALVTSNWRPRKGLTVADLEEKQDSPNRKHDKMVAEILSTIVNEVWVQSNGRSIQRENGTLSQFLGGCVFQFKWQPQRDDLRIPILIQTISPDFFLPIWNNDNYWDLLEGYVVYQITSAAARAMYGHEGSEAMVLYTEHWTKDQYSIYLDGEPLTSKMEANGKTKEVTFKDLPNPFGIVPFVYIPHLREGNFYGSSMVEDIEGLMLEYNARMADKGDAIRKTVHRKRYMRDVGNISMRVLDEGVQAVDLGKTPPTSKNPPDVFSEDPPQYSPALMGYTDELWDNLLREGHVSPTAFGEDEGSQRSALTLAIKMWPSTSHARAERDHWTDGLNQSAQIIIRMVRAHLSSTPLKGLNIEIPEDVFHRFLVTQSWMPMIPRDRESTVNEMVLRTQAKLASPQLALEEFGDIPDVEDELDRIIEWTKLMQEVLPEGSDAGGIDHSEPIVDNQPPVAILDTD